MIDEIKIETFKPSEILPDNVILPQQTHGANIIRFETGLENLNNCDGLWTKRNDLLLGVKTADCAPICVWNQSQFGVVHAGWRGTVNGVIENMLKVFEFELSSNSSRDAVQNHPGMEIWIGPILPRFEIQIDDCYQKIYNKFGDRFFTEIKVDLEIQNQVNTPINSHPDSLKPRSTLIFEFKKCLQFMLPEAKFDTRSTFRDRTLSSWRRDKHFENGQNVTVIGPAHLF